MFEPWMPCTRFTQAIGLTLPRACFQLMAASYTHSIVVWASEFWMTDILEFGYRIAHFRPEHETQVVNLLGELWRCDSQTRSSLFRWKYLENPFSDGPIGVVALHDDTVVGFRGYFANRFIVGSQVTGQGVLQPGDLYVDPGHRNRGLSVAMGQHAMEYDTSRFRLFLNLSCSKASLRGNLALGFQPLAAKVRLTRHGLNPLDWWRSRKGETRRPLEQSRINFGQFGKVQVADAPLPAAMASIVANQRHAEAALHLQQDHSFFAWRYRNPARKYAFYFLAEDNCITGYVAVHVSANNVLGRILDYGECREWAVREILTYIIKSRHFPALSIVSYGADEQPRQLFAELGFSTTHPLKKLTATASAGQAGVPALVRPIRQSFSERDLMIDAVDVRRIDSWRLKPICCDSA